MPSAIEWGGCALQPEVEAGHLGRRAVRHGPPEQLGRRGRTAGGDDDGGRVGELAHRVAGHDPGAGTGGHAGERHDELIPAALEVAHARTRALLHHLHRDLGAHRCGVVRVGGEPGEQVQHLAHPPAAGDAVDPLVRGAVGVLAGALAGERRQHAPELGLVAGTEGRGGQQGAGAGRGPVHPPVAHDDARHPRGNAGGSDAQLVERPLGRAAPVEGVRALVEAEPVALVGGRPPAEPVAGLVHRHPGAGPGGEGGGGEAGQAAPDDVDLASVLHAHLTRTQVLT